MTGELLESIMDRIERLRRESESNLVNVIPCKMDGLVKNP